ncbi:MAG: 5-formyltetrahydrofolate cyclo-ligase [Gammaproteobacteria bacterium]|nr:5-formyltetrahydrofolate cyclo-ligase [Gammaproteobacteria bacterium]
MKTVPSQQSLKSELRKEFRCKRAELEPSHRAGLDTSINQHLDDFLRREQARTIAAYRAFDGEPDLAEALCAARDRGLTVALPVVHEEPGRAAIEFRQWSAEGGLARNRFGIEEPVDAPLVPVNELDIVLIPLVAWDVSGGRLGMGASFYDRFFQPFAGQDRPLRVGVGYDIQQAGELALEPWDIRMHRILSESGLQTCGASGS